MRAAAARVAIVQALLALIAACIGFALLGRRARVPCAVVLGGMVLAFLPGAPRVEPEPALAFFLPPLLPASADRTDWAAFKGKLRPILPLVPALPWAAAIALGAIVAPPDAVAVSLAAALALPAGFPGRDLPVFLAFCACLTTLVVQGTTLDWLNRRLGAEQRAVRGMPAAEAAARAAVARAALIGHRRRVRRRGIRAA